MVQLARPRLRSWSRTVLSKLQRTILAQLALTGGLVALGLYWVVAGGPEQSGVPLGSSAFGESAEVPAVGAGRDQSAEEYTRSRETLSRLRS